MKYRHRLRAAAAAALAVSSIAAGSARASLVDGDYLLFGSFDDARNTFSGSFTVAGGSVQGLSIGTTRIYKFGVDSIYTGGGVNEDVGTMFSASLTLTNLFPSATGTGYLNLGTDGRFHCGGVSLFSYTDTCQLMTQVFGESASEKDGSYRIERVATVPVPATGLLVLTGLAGLVGARRARNGAAAT